jgi:hypothetical protein
MNFVPELSNILVIGYIPRFEFFTAVKLEINVFSGLLHFAV